jgi:leucine-rich PPR motif-containing protein
MLENNIAPNIVSYSILIDGLCKRGLMKEASCAFRCALDKHLLPDVIAYTILIRGYCKVGRLTEAMMFYDNMLLNRLTPDRFLERTLEEYQLKKAGAKHLCA